MFRKGKESERPVPEGRQSASRSGEMTYLSGSFRLIGDLAVPGALRLEGSIDGNVRARGPVYLGRQAVVHGNVSALEATVAGRIAGDLQTRGSVDLLAGCRLEGDVCARSFRIEEGAFFQGNYDSRVDDDGDEELSYRG